MLNKIEAALRATVSQIRSSGGPQKLYSSNKLAELDILNLVPVNKTAWGEGCHEGIEYHNYHHSVTQLMYCRLPARGTRLSQGTARLCQGSPVTVLGAAGAWPDISRLTEEN